MRERIEKLVTAYIEGRLTRAALVDRLCDAGAAGSPAQPDGVDPAAPSAGPEAGDPTLQAGGDALAPTLRVMGLNHIALGVDSVPESRDFYVRHLGCTVWRDEGERMCFLHAGRDFIALFPETPPALDHYAYTVEDFDEQRCVEALEAAGLAPYTHSGRVYFKDCNGLTVQVAPPDMKARATAHWRKRGYIS